MKRPKGFLLIEILVAVGVLAAAFLAAAEALAAARLAERRRGFQDAVAACAESRLAMTLIGPGAPTIPCDPAVRVEMDSALPMGDVEQVTWRMSTAGFAEERFTTVRYAR